MRERGGRKPAFFDRVPTNEQTKSKRHKEAEERIKEKKKKRLASDANLLEKIKFYAAQGYSINGMKTKIGADRDRISALVKTNGVKITWRPPSKAEMVRAAIKPEKKVFKERVIIDFAAALRNAENSKPVEKSKYPKLLKCIGADCGNEFVSSGPGNRMCQRCRSNS